MVPIKLPLGHDSRDLSIRSLVFFFLSFILSFFLLVPLFLVQPGAHMALRTRTHLSNECCSDLVDSYIVPMWQLFTIGVGNFFFWRDDFR